MLGEAAVLKVGVVLPRSKIVNSPHQSPIKISWGANTRRGLSPRKRGRQGLWEGRKGTTFAETDRESKSK